MLGQALLVALGGAVGCTIRFLVSLFFQHVGATAFPWGTLGVNLVGCLVMGGVASVLVGPVPAAEPWRLVLAVGFLGGLTTFSSFGLETFLMLSAERYIPAASYVLASNVLGIAFVGAGWKLAQIFFR